MHTQTGINSGPMVLVAISDYSLRSILLWTYICSLQARHTLKAFVDFMPQLIGYSLSQTLKNLSRVVGVSEHESVLPKLIIQTNTSGTLSL